MNAQDEDDKVAGVVVNLHAHQRGARSLAISVRQRRHGPWTVIEIDGEMDLQAVALMPRLPRKRLARVVVDLAGVTFMDAGGLGVLAALQRRALAAGGVICLAAPSQPALRLMGLTGSERAFAMFDSVDEALTASPARA